MTKRATEPLWLDPRSHLPTLVETLDADLLEMEWRGVQAERSIEAMPLEDLDSFFFSYSSAIEAAMRESSEKWLARLRAYGQRTASFRRDCRSKTLRYIDQSTAQRYWARFHAWHLSGVREPDERTVFLESYRLELWARLTTDFDEKIEALGRAIEHCRSAGTDRPLLRRTQTLLAQRDQYRAFWAIRRRQLIDAGVHLSRAVAHAEAAQEILFVRGDNFVPYLSFWLQTTLCRAAQVAHNTEAALDAWQEAKLCLSSLRADEVVFARGWWRDISDFTSEPDLIRAQAALETLPPDLLTCAGSLGAWLEKQSHQHDSIRYVQVEIRHLSAQLLLTTSDDTHALRTISRLRNLLQSYASIQPSTLGVGEAAAQAFDAWRNGADQTEASLRYDNGLDLLRQYFALDALAPPLSGWLKGLRYSTLPSWLHPASGTADDGLEQAAALARYLRVAADYLWSYYERKLSNQRGAPLRVRRPLLPTIRGAADELLRLRRLVSWDREGQQAIDGLIQVAREAESLEPERRAPLLVEAIERCEKHLFPLIAQLTQIQRSAEPGKEGRRAATFFRPDAAEELRAYIHDEDLAFVNGWYYLKPMVRAARGDLRGPVHSYEARGLPLFSSAVIACEGESDLGALESTLSAIDDSWMGNGDRLRIVILEGDNAVSRRDSRRLQMSKETPWVMVADHEKKVQENRRWSELWEGCCWQFIVDPYLELLSLEALAVALGNHFHVPIATSQLQALLEDVGPTDFVSELQEKVQRRTREKVEPIKSRAFGRRLGEAWNHLEIPTPLHEAAETALLLCSGHIAPCQVQPGIAHVHPAHPEPPWRRDPRRYRLTQRDLNHGASSVTPRRVTRASSG